MVLITKSKVSGGGVNPKETCLSCVYCWNDKINDMRDPTKKYDHIINNNVKELLSQIENEEYEYYPEHLCQFYYVEDRWLQYSTKIDGFQEDMFDLPHMILQVIGIGGLGKNLRILSKRDYRTFLSSVPVGAYCGVSYTTSSDEVSKLIEWGNALPSERIKVLQEAHARGFVTWASCEPCLEGFDAVEFIIQVPFIRQIYFGPMTGAKKRQHPEEGMIEVPCLSKHEVVKEFRKAVKFCKEMGLQIQLFLKNQAGGWEKTKEIWAEFEYWPETIPIEGGSLK